MKTAYFDCSSGSAGNMILAALIDTGISKDYLQKELQKLQITSSKSQTNFKLQISNIKRNGIKAKYLKVLARDKQAHRSLADIIRTIKNSRLKTKVKRLSIRIFQRLAGAEAKVHGIAIDQVHFHEVGAIDAIVDIVGTAICLDKLKIEYVFASPLPFGQGSIKCSHGILANPAPATLELTKNTPTYRTNIKGELVTPTGAAIITTIAKDFNNAPPIEVERIGYGAGSKQYKGIPGSLRVFIGEAKLATEKDAVLKIETNIDDMDPNQYDPTIAKLMKAGALDAFITPIQMKKSRKAIKLTVLCDPKIKDRILDGIFTLTTAFGVRIYMVKREKLSRKHIKVKTKYGTVRIKAGYTLAPEFEDIKKLAKKHRLPLSKINQAAWNKLK